MNVHIENIKKLVNEYDYYTNLIINKNISLNLIKKKHKNEYIINKYGESYNYFTSRDNLNVALMLLFNIYNLDLDMSLNGTYNYIIDTLISDNKNKIKSLSKFTDLESRYHIAQGIIAGLKEIDILYFLEVDYSNRSKLYDKEINLLRKKLVYESIYRKYSINFVLSDSTCKEILIDNKIIKEEFSLLDYIEWKNSKSYLWL